ncbi:MAG TPA: hypothetical protein VNH83_24745 [Bryobacteraceae bacterium]|nr:hypothetical protein [Bryobacteraceae bacterium]
MLRQAGKRHKVVEVGFHIGVFIFDYPILKYLGQFDATYVLKVES